MKRIYIVHGWAYGLEKWDVASQLMKQTGFEPVFLHVPGLTKESKKAWDMPGYVDWLHKELAKEKAPAILLGHSNGGRIALNFALKYPEKIKQLILLDSAGVYHDGLKIRTKRAVFKGLAKAGKLISKSAFLRKVLYKLAREQDYLNAPEHMRKTMANMLESDKLLKPERVTVHTTLIWGEEDSATPPADAYVLQRKIAGSTIHWVKEARHSPHHTHPEEFVTILKEVVT